MSMKEAFEKLKKDGHNTVDNVIQLLKDAQLITVQTGKDAEAETRKLLEETKDQANVDLDKFSEVVKVAKEQERAMEEVCSALNRELPRLATAVQEAAKAFNEVIKKK